MSLVLVAATLAGAQTPEGGDTPSADPTFPYTDGSVEEGTAKAAPCVACHGVNGNSTNPEWPNLAGQNAIYIAEQLRLFKTGVRTDPLMTPMATPLTEADINDLAVYFEAQTPTGLEADPSYWESGQLLYMHGDTSRDIPACVSCHGPVGRGNPAAGYPALRAQHSVYTVKQLNNYKNGSRYAGAKDVATASRNGAMMHAIAERLTAEDIRDLASYIQGLR